MNRSLSKTKKKFTVVDLLLILLILALLAGIGYLIRSFILDRAKADADVVTLEYVIELRGVRKEWENQITSGAILTDPETSCRLGEITAVSSQLSRAESVDRSGTVPTLVITDYPDHADLYLTLKTTASVQKDGTYLLDGGYRLMVGNEIEICLPSFHGTGVCTQMKEAGGR